MNTHDDGGPAFPVSADVNPDGNQSGLRIRDYFAAAALQGWMATYVGDRDNHPGQDPFWANNVAKDCYAMADAMIAARKEAR